MRYTVTAIIAALLLGCGGFRPVKSADTEQVYVVEHSAESQLAAFDKLDEWIALSWQSAQDVVQTKNERTGTFVVKWITPVSIAGQPVLARSSALVKASDTNVTFTLVASPGPGAKALTEMVLTDVYAEWAAMMAQTPWGPATLTKAGYTAPGSSGKCRSDRDCDRGFRCGDSGQCVGE